MCWFCLLQSEDLELWFQAMREPSDDGEEVEEDMEEDVDTSKLNVSSNHTNTHTRTHTHTHTHTQTHSQSVTPYCVQCIHLIHDSVCKSTCPVFSC